MNTMDLYQCEKCMKGLANRHSLSRHKKTCQASRGRKRPSVDGTETVSKNPKIQALADAIINDTKVDSSFPATDVFQKLPSPPREVVGKLPSPPQEVVDDVFKVPRTKKDLVGCSDSDVDSTEDKKSLDNDDQESCSDKESINNSSDDQESCSDKESDDNSENGSSTEDSSDDNSTDNSNDEAADEQPIVTVLPKSIKGLEKKFNARFVEFTRHGKHENRNELMTLLDEKLRRQAVEASEYKRLNDLIASSLPTGEEKKSNDQSIDDLTDTFIKLYKRFECEGKKNQQIDLVTTLDQLKHQEGISRQN